MGNIPADEQGTNKFVVDIILALVALQTTDLS